MPILTIARKFIMQVCMESNLAKSLTKFLGASRLEAALGVSSHSVRAACTQGLFPSSWYLVVRDLCAEQGVVCPVKAFKWRSPVLEALDD